MTLAFRRILTLLVAAFLGFGLWVVLRPQPSLEEAVASARSGKLDEAEEQARSYVSHHKEDLRGRLLLAQILLDRFGPGLTPEKSPDPIVAAETVKLLDELQALPRSERARAMVMRGKALFRLGRVSDAETDWRKAIDLEPSVAEAGWGLLEILYLQGRGEESRALVFKLYGSEPDPRDQIQLLLELLRQDARPPAPGSVVAFLDPIVKQHPNDTQSTYALAQALILEGQAADRGLSILRRLLSEAPNSSEAWRHYLTGLDNSGQIDVFQAELSKLPAAFASDPRFSPFRGRSAQERRDWGLAIDEFKSALKYAPHDVRIEYRLVRALRSANRSPEADRLDACRLEHAKAAEEARTLHEAADASKHLFLDAASLSDPSPSSPLSLLRRLVDNRLRLARFDEASAWLVRLSRLRPDDPETRDLSRSLEEARRRDPTVGKPANP